jgi:hypothetical protein
MKINSLHVVRANARLASVALSGLGGMRGVGLRERTVFLFSCLSEGDRKA